MSRCSINIPATINRIHTFGGGAEDTRGVDSPQGLAFVSSKTLKIQGTCPSEVIEMLNARRIRVLCVDDHPLIRDGIASALQTQADMEVVAEAANGVEAIEAFRKHSPDVTLMDLRMPQMNGILATTAILKEFPRAKIVMLTTYSGDVNATRALRCGAKGYLLKSMLRSELVDTLRRVHSGHQHIPAEIAQEMACHLSADALSTRELEVLRTVSMGNSNKAVASELCITEDTVKGHLRNILAKLRANDRTHAVMIGLERGYLD